MAMTAMETATVLGQTLVNFSRDARFPEDDETSKIYVGGEALPVALKAVATARSELEEEIRKISRESAPGVDTWIKHAKALQEDIERSKTLASEIVREAEAGDLLYQKQKQEEDHAEFLEKEVSYNAQLLNALHGIKQVKEVLNQAEEAGTSGRILESLHLLSSAWDMMNTVPADQKTRPLIVLNQRAFELKASIHEGFTMTWNNLVYINAENGNVTIDNSSGAVTSIPKAITIMKAYKEEDQRIKKLYEDFHNVIIRPRVVFKSGVLSSIVVEDNTIRRSSEHADLSVKALFSDLDKIVDYLTVNLPTEFAQSLSRVLMPNLIKLIKETWLDSAVPVSLDDMNDFRKAIALVQVFAEKIAFLGWEGAEELHDWVESAPRLWVTKRRETSLDWTRNQLSLGIGNAREVERKETQLVSDNEGDQFANTQGASEGKGNEWDAAWSDDDGEREPRNSESTTSPSLDQEKLSWTAEVLKEDKANENNEVDDAWGWGDEDEPEDLDATPLAQEAVGLVLEKKQKEVTLTEKYLISSMPEPVLKTIISIIEDGTTLTHEYNDSNPVTAAAVGLFGLPTLVLAMYRAVTPYYYNLSSGGNMYLYNDAMWLAENLQTFAASWADRPDLGPRARGKVRLDNETSMLNKFARRAYGNEMSIQRTVLTDLLGGAQNLFAQDGGRHDDTAAIESVIIHIRALSSTWKTILSKSAWAQAIGSLLSTVARKVILDVEDLPSLGADAAYRVANLISEVIKLDDLFLPEDPKAEQIPMTSQYAPNWLKLNFLSEVLQSDLKDVLYLWMESDLSLYFGVQEVVDLIEGSFEKSVRTREAIQRIRDTPRPRGVSADDR